MARVISANAIPQISGYGIAGAGFPAAAYGAYGASVYGAAPTVVAPTYGAPVQATGPFLSSAVVPSIAPRIDDVLGYGGYGVGVVPAGLNGAYAGLNGAYAGLNGAYLNSSLYGGRSIIPTAGYYGYSSAAGLGVPAYSAGAVPTYGATALNGGLISGIGATAYVNNGLPTYGAAYAPQYFGGYSGLGNGVAVAQL